MLILSGEEKIGPLIQEKFPNDFYTVAPGRWMISAPGMTTNGISDALGITDGSRGTGIVFAFNSYFGRANPQVWEWINAKQGVAKNG